jgi:hypothetical protein
VTAGARFELARVTKRLSAMDGERERESSHSCRCRNRKQVDSEANSIDFESSTDDATRERNPASIRSPNRPQLWGNGIASLGSFCSPLPLAGGRSVASQQSTLVRSQVAGWKIERRWRIHSSEWDAPVGGIDNSRRRNARKSAKAHPGEDGSGNPRRMEGNHCHDSDSEHDNAPA